jgi:hypothetical protein
VRVDKILLLLLTEQEEQRISITFHFVVKQGMYHLSVLKGFMRTEWGVIVKYKFEQKYVFDLYLKWYSFARINQSISLFVMATNREENVVPRIHPLSDMATGQPEMLMSINGYEDMPLVPLEIAVEPLIFLVPVIHIHAYSATERCKNPPADGLTIDESAWLLTKEEIIFTHVIEIIGE